MTEADLRIVRRAFALQMAAIAGVSANARLIDAMAAVPRERFLGDGPWCVKDFGRDPLVLPANDAVLAYQDLLFVLCPPRGVNNGSPSLHAAMLDALDVRPGARIAHMGAGTGYYSAILAQLAGPNGTVTAWEIDLSLAGMARAALADRPNVELRTEDAATAPRGDVDGIYVNFAVTAPREAWLDALAPGGRLVVPLGVPGRAERPGGPVYSTWGAVFAVTRRPGGYAARAIRPASFIHGEGGAAADGSVAASLQDAFEAGGIGAVRSLVRTNDVDPARAWLRTPRFSLSFDDV